MTQVYIETGELVPVTVIEAGPCPVVQVKREKTDGYNAIQIGFGSKKEKNTSNGALGHFKKAGTSALRHLREIRLDSEPQEEAGSSLTVEIFEGESKVDVIGTSIGKGFAGTVKRHNFSMQDATHGNSLSHRAPGSIGQNQTPGRVFKGKKMSGHMGNVRRTIQNLEVVRVDNERNLLLIRGAVPGHAGGRVIVRPAIKSKR